MMDTQEFSYDDKNYSVPEFFAYDHKSTKWIITLLSTQDGLKRLSLMGKENGRLFETYFQIPDEPKIFSKNMHHSEQYAYHSNGVLYLNPLGLAIYMKQSEAVRVLLKLKNKYGIRIIHPNEICFVQQRTAQQIADKPCNDLQSTYPALIAVRRGFSEGLSLLMNAGYQPQKEFGIICRKGDGETLSIYRDLVDYALDLLRTKPGINITSIIKTITNPTIRNSYDIYTYDVEINPETEQVEWVSVFRRVAQMGAKNNYASHRNGVAIISVLETLQRLGFLKGLIYENKDVSSTPLPHRSIGSAMSIMVDKNIKSQKPVEKINRNNMIDDPKAYNRVTYDRDASIGAILIWYQLILQNGRGIQKEKIELLISKCLWDTESVKLFFGLENEQIALVFNNWIDNTSQEIRPETIRHLRNATLHQYTYVQKLYLPFIKKYHFEPKDLIRRGPVPFNINQIINPEWIKRPLYFQCNAEANPTKESGNLVDNSQEMKSSRNVSMRDSSTIAPPNNQDEKNMKRLQKNISPEPNYTAPSGSKKNHSVSCETEPIRHHHHRKNSKQVNFDSSMTDFSIVGQENQKKLYTKARHGDSMASNGDNIRINSNGEPYYYQETLSPKPMHKKYAQNLKSKRKPIKKVEKREVHIREETESESEDSCGSGSTVEIIKTKINRKTKQKQQTVYKVKGEKSVKKHNRNDVHKELRCPKMNNYGDTNNVIPKKPYNSMGAKISQQLTVIEIDDDQGTLYADKRGDNGSLSSESSPDIETSDFLVKQTNQQNCRNKSGMKIERSQRLQQSIASSAIDQEEINNYSDDNSSNTADTKSSSNATIRRSNSPRSNFTNSPPRFEKNRVIDKPLIKSGLPHITMKDKPKHPRPCSTSSSVDTNTGGTTNIQNTMSAIMRQFVINMNTNGALKLMR